MTSPPMAYYGGKTRLAAKIAALLPPHEHYVEPFAGSLAVLLAKKPSRMETVNDLDDLLMTFWKVLRDKPAELARECALTPHSRSEYLAARSANLEDLDDVERARLVWVMISQGRGGCLELAQSDDFLIGKVDGDRLVSLQWMEEVRDDRGELVDVATQLCLEVSR